MKKRLLYSKKGISTETAILSSLIFIFVILAICLPLIFIDFGKSYDLQDYSKIKDTAESQKISDAGFSIWELTGLPFIDVIISIFVMATWTWGGIPIWIDLLILTPLRLIFWVVLYKLLRSGT